MRLGCLFGWERREKRVEEEEVFWEEIKRLMKMKKKIFRQREKWA